MRQYECLFITKTDITDEKKAELQQKIEGLLAKQGGGLTSYDDWGKRKFAYEIDKTFKGNYFLARFNCPPQGLAEVERNLKLNDNIVRFQTMLLKVAKQPVVAAANAG